MIGVALKGLAGRKLRAVLTAFAIVLGVAMVSGSYILTGTIAKAFNRILADSPGGTSAVIRGKEEFLGRMVPASAQLVDFESILYVPDPARAPLVHGSFRVCCDPGEVGPTVQGLSRRVELFDRHLG